MTMVDGRPWSPRFFMVFDGQPSNTMLKSLSGPWLIVVDHGRPLFVRKPTFWILTRSDTNQAIQPLEMARGLKFCI